MSLLTYVGLEHTGHHLWDAVFTGVLPSASNAHGYMFSRFVTQGHAIDANELAKALRADRQAAIGSGRGHLPLRFNSCSFPCNEKAAVDEVLIFRAIRMAGLEVRALLMTRAELEIVYNFNLPRIRLLEQSCKAMVSQLTVLLQEHHMLHVPYHAAPKLGRAISKFIGYNITDKLLATYRVTNRSATAAAELRAKKLDEALSWRSLRQCSEGVLSLARSVSNGQKLSALGGLANTILHRRNASVPAIRAASIAHSRSKP